MHLTPYLTTVLCCSLACKAAEYTLASTTESRQQPVEDHSDSASTLDGVVLISLLFSCCLLPLVLAGLPMASAWLSRFPPFVSYRPWLAMVALICTVLGWRRIYRPASIRRAGYACAPAPGMGAKVIFWLVTYSTWSVLGLPYFEKYLY